MEAQADAVAKDAEAAVMPEGPNFRMGLMEIDRQAKSIKVFIGANRITPWLHIENFPQPMPPLEALACFPADTYVSAEDAVRGIERLYTGKLYNIKTKQGTIIATAEHPFWTQHGWRNAEHLDIDSQLWYNPTKDHNTEDFHASQRNFANSVFTGRIKDVVAKVSDLHSPRIGRFAEQAIIFGQVAASQIESQENMARYSYTSSLRGIPYSLGLFGWDNRCGWLRHASPNITWGEQKQENTPRSTDNEYLTQTFVLAGANCARAIHLPRMGYTLQELCSSMALPYEWIGKPTFVRGSGSILGSEAQADGASYRILSGAVRSASHGRLHRTSVGYLQKDTGAQYIPIQEISCREVTNFPVYNLTTDSEQYWAEGFLVHNCGVPVVVPRGVGLLDDLPDAPGVYRYETSNFDKMCKAIEKALVGDHDREALAALALPYNAHDWAEGHKRAFIDLRAGPPATVESDRHGKRGVYYVAYGKPSRRCAEAAIASFKEHMDGVEVALASTEPLGPEDLFVRCDDVDIGGRHAKTMIYDLAPRDWQYVMYLDADTKVCADVSFLYQCLIDGWDMVICKNPAKYHIAREMQRSDNHDECEYTFQQLGTNQLVQLNGGVFAF